MRRAAALALALLALAGATRAAPPLPLAVARDVPGLAPLGEGRLHFLLFHVYDAALWTAGGRYAPDAPHALDIRYAMAVSGAELAAASVEEMRKQGVTGEAVLAAWRREMERVFPDIRAGDRLVGVHLPGREARFYGAAGLLGTVKDPEFARAFFAIWLAESTSEPALRRRLLRLEGPAP